MRIYDYNFTPYELSLLAALGLILTLLILSKLPKRFRVSILGFLFLGTVFAFFSHVSELQQADTKKIAKKKEIKYQTINILYGTDRSNVNNKNRIVYSEGRGRKLILGSSVVTIPRVRRTVEAGMGGTIKQITLKASDQQSLNRHFTVHKVSELSKEEFVAQSREAMSGSVRFRDQAFVFIHGYNISFDGALFRTAQLAHDLKFDGVPYLFSWPSAGGVTKYEYDLNSSQQSRPYLKQFLDIVTKETGAKQVHIIAHSMGNAPLLEVLKDLRQKPEQERITNINQVIMVAPDVDRDVFINLAKQIEGLGKRITLYVSSSDLAMKASRLYSGTVRAGDVPENGPIVIQGLDTIDVTKLSTSVFYSLNLTLYAESRMVLQDIAKLMAGPVQQPHVRSPKMKQNKGAEDRSFWRYSE